MGKIRIIPKESNILLLTEKDILNWKLGTEYNIFDISIYNPDVIKSFENSAIVTYTYDNGLEVVLKNRYYYGRE